MGRYSTRTPPGCAERSRTTLGITGVPGMRCDKFEKNTFLCLSLFFCQSSQILSINPWWRKNSGAAAESIVHMVPSIKQCTKSCKFIRSMNSKSLKLRGWTSKTIWTATASGGVPKNIRAKHRGPGPVGIPGGSGTILHTSCLKGPVWTQLYIPSPSPPRPESSLDHMLRAAVVLNALPGLALQSQ